jgi:hypothetical protein
MEKKRYSMPEVRCTKIDCEIIMQSQSDEMSGPGEIPNATGFINPLKWFK